MKLKKNKKIAIKKVVIKFDIKTKSNQMLRDETKKYISIQKWIQNQKIAVKKIRIKSKKIRMTPFIFGRAA
jgi:hypothetical protein